MKKFYLTLAFFACIGLLSAQQVIPKQQKMNLKKEVSEMSQAEMQKKVKAEQKQFQNRKSSSKLIKSRWYNAGFEIDNLLGGLASVAANNIFPDTTILVNYSSGYSGPWIHSIAECIDPTSSWFDPLPGSGVLDIAKFMPYTVDSIAMYCIYQRSLPASIVDTLLVQVRQVSSGYRYWNQGTAPWIQTNFMTDTLAFRAVPFDQYKYYSTDNDVVTMKYPLTAASENDTTAAGWNYFKVAPQTPLNVDPGAQVIVTFGFIPGYTWTANVDTLTSKNRLRFASLEENGAGTYCSYTKWDWTCSFIENQDDLYETDATRCFQTSSFAYSWSVPDYAYEHHMVEVLLTADHTEGVQTITNNSLSLNQNRPNPVSGNTTIEYQLNNNSKDVKITIFDLYGRIVMEENQGSQTAGQYSIDINTDNLADGNYYYSLTADGNRITKKMIVLK